MEHINKILALIDDALDDGEPEPEDEDFACTCGSRAADPGAHAYHCGFAGLADDPRI